MMKLFSFCLVAILLFSCQNQGGNGAINTPSNPAMNQQELTNETVREYSFLAGMYGDSYFPKVAVDQVRNVLVKLCFAIENEQPKDLEALYRLTHASTEEINDLQAVFDANGSELETVAREVIALDIDFIARAYGFEADLEELIAPRDW